MSMFSAELLQTPSVRQFLHLLLGDLANRRSLLVLVPAGVDPATLWQALRQELWRHDFHVHDAWLPGLPMDHPPVAALGESLGVTWASSDASQAITKLMTSEQFPDVIYLNGFDELPEAARIHWITFLVRWAQACQGVADRGVMPSALCLLVPATTVLSQLPESNVYLSVRWWWGFPSALEIHLLCRFGSESAEQDTTALWREYLVPSLTGNDVSLVEYLWDTMHLSYDDLTRHLQLFGEKRGWAGKTLRTWGAEELMTNAVGDSHTDGSSDRPVPPPARLRLLWAHGALCWTPEYGVELHPAALAVLGQHEDLKHRFWRGQAMFLLPLIDNIRLVLCNYLRGRYGQDWPVRWYPPASEEEESAVRKSPFACQWGHLKKLLIHCADLRREHRWRPLVERVSWVRNELAHFRPVTLNDFADIWQEIQRLKKTGTFGLIRRKSPS